MHVGSAEVDGKCLVSLLLLKVEGRNYVGGENGGLVFRKLEGRFDKATFTFSARWIQIRVDRTAL